MIEWIESTEIDSDWIKTLSWDLPTELEQFLSAIGGVDKLDHFMELPAAKAMPASLRGELLVYEQDEIVKAAESYTPTKGMKTAAERALRWKKEGKAKGAGTPVGWGRATDIAAGRAMSLDIVKRMYSFFSRHEVDKQGKDFDNISNPSNGRIMWDAWGGDAGFTWSRAIVERAKRVEKHLPYQHDQSSHAGGSSAGIKQLPQKIKSIENLPYAIKHFTKVDAPELTDTLRQYTIPSGMYRELNAAHRGGYNPQSPVLPLSDPLIAKWTDDLDTAISKAPKLTEPIVAFRGINSNYGDSLQLGGSYKDKGFMSVSLNEKAAGGFGGYGQRRTTLRISVPSGTKALAPNLFGVGRKTEQELILGRGQEFTVTAITESSMFGKIVDVELNG